MLGQELHIVNASAESDFEPAFETIAKLQVAGLFVGLTRVALLGNQGTTPFDYFRRAAEDAAPLLSVEIVAFPLSADTDIEQIVKRFARVPNGGLPICQIPR